MNAGKDNQAMNAEPETKEESKVTSLVYLPQQGEAGNMPSAEELGRIVELVERVVKTQMKPGVDYGPPYPGAKGKICYIGGLDKLGVVFRIRPRSTMETDDLGDRHRSFTCKMEGFWPDGTFLGEAHACCNTMEEAFMAEFQPYGDVPKEYWDDKSPEKEKKKKYFNSEEAVVKKRYVNGRERWMYGWMRDVPPARNYNKCMKIAEKRAWAALVYRVTAARNFFEDYSPENPEAAHGTDSQNPPNESERSNNQDGPELTVQEKTLLKYVGNDGIKRKVFESGIKFGSTREYYDAVMEYVWKRREGERLNDWDFVNRVKANSTGFIDEFIQYYNEPKNDGKADEENLPF